MTLTGGFFSVEGFRMNDILRWQWQRLWPVALETVGVRCSLADNAVLRSLRVSSSGVQVNPSGPEDDSQKQNGKQPLFHCYRR